MRGTSAREATPEATGLLYLYGIAREQGRPPANVVSVAYHRLVALVEPVSPTDFAPEALARNLASVAWVADLARRHEARLGRR